MTRQDLKDYKYTEEWIKDRREYLKERKTILENITATISDMPKGSRKAQDGFADKLVQILDDNDEMIDKIYRQCKKQKAILEQIERLSEPYRLILDKVYIQGKSLVTVASEMNYDYKHICYMNGIALKKFEKLDK